MVGFISLEEDLRRLIARERRKMYAESTRRGVHISLIEKRSDDLDENAEEILEHMRQTHPRAEEDFEIPDVPESLSRENIIAQIKRNIGLRGYVEAGQTIEGAHLFMKDREIYTVKECILREENKLKVYSFKTGRED